MKKILFVLPVMFLLAAGCSSTPRQTINENTPNLPAQKKSVQNPAASSTPSLASDWKTYTNQEYGFEFRYPKELTFDINSTKDFGLTITGNFTDMDEFVKSAKKYDSETGQRKTYTSITVGGVPGISVQEQGQATKADEVFFIKNTKLYDFVFMKVDQATANQILSTFKFTK